MQNKLATAVLAIAIVALGGYTFTHQTTTQTSPQVVQSGALSSPNISSPYLAWGGVIRWAGSMSMQTGTSTLCDIQSPAATSTLKNVTARFDSLPTYATTYQWGLSATRNATTTSIVASYTPTSSLPNIIATSTASATTDGVIAPNTHIVLNLSTSTATGASVATGFCAVTFDQI